MRLLKRQVIFFIFLQLSACTEKINQANTSLGTGQTTAAAEDVHGGGHPSFRIQAPSEPLVGVYYMPSWDFSSKGTQKDVFWACLQGKEDCPFLHNTSIWGPKGRIYNDAYPYEGPYLDKKPHSSLKGFYHRTDPEVVRKQLAYMKKYGIDFFAYNWYFGRHYYYHRDFAPQAKVFYPQDWPVNAARSGRVMVPGVEEWTEQLEVLLAENEKLPIEDQMRFAINWVDDGPERWEAWLNLGSPENLKNNVNYPGEKPDKALFLKVHDKMTLLWIQKYFKRSDYLKDEEGRPIVYFYFPHDTESRASYYGVSISELLERSKALAREAGMKGIKFIAVAAGAMQPAELPFAMPTHWKPKDPKRPWLGGTYVDKMLFQDYVPRLRKMGFEGLTAYIYHSFYGQDNKSYKDMRKTYRGHWQKWSEYFKNDPDFEYQVPVAMGWNMKPMGGTWPQPSGFPSEPEKDRVISNKASFKEKLQEAKKISEAYASETGSTIMVCCWNEYLEGNHIEPTVGHGFDYLEAIQEVFPQD